MTKVDVINNNLSDDKENNIVIDEAPIKAENFPLGAPKEYHDEILAMTSKHEKLWEVHLEEIRDTEHRIYLKDDARPFRSAPFREGPKHASLNKQRWRNS